MTTAASLEGHERAALLRRGFAREYATLGWNVAGIAVLAVAAVTARQARSRATLGD